MAKPSHIELVSGLTIPILYEDRAVLAIDKPAGWLLAPDSWDRTGRNLQLALLSSLHGGDFWARSRQLKFLRFVHRLDAETSGALLFAKSPGALREFSRLFQDRSVEKTYLAIVRGAPLQREWTCRWPIAPDPERAGRFVALKPRAGSSGAGRKVLRPRSGDVKPAETQFRVIEARGDRSLLEVEPLTGRTHQIRVHLQAAGHPVVGDALYGGVRPDETDGLALRAVRLAYRDPFTRRAVEITAGVKEFLKRFGFAATAETRLPQTDTHREHRLPTGSRGLARSTAKPESAGAPAAGPAPLRPSAAVPASRHRSS